MEDVFDDTLHVVDANNSLYGFAESRQRSNSRKSPMYKHVTVWGGVIANCGEDQVSDCVNNSRDTLESFTYFPASTKGGVMVRPLYCRGDRNGTVVFSALTDLTMPLRALDWSETLTKCGWITPKLKSLCLLTPYEVGVTSLTQIPILEGLLAEAPHLEQIRIATAEFGTPDVINVKISILPPAPISWEKKRLLLIALKKESMPACPLASLPVDIMQYLFSMLGRADWKIEYSKEDDVKEDNDDATGL
jgi:hypothetical protein